MTRKLQYGQTGQGPRLTSDVLSEGIQERRKEQHLHVRLGELNSVLAEKTAEILRLEIYKEQIEHAIRKIEQILVSKFKMRLRAVAAEVIALKPTTISKDLPNGILNDSLRIELTRKQRSEFVETLMSAGMGKKSANGFVSSISSRMGSNRLWLMEEYFNNVLSPELAQQLVTRKGNLIYGMPCEYREVVLPKKYHVALTRDDVIAEEGKPPTLTEEAKHRLRKKILSAVLFEDIDLNMLFGKDSKTFDDLAKVISDAMAVYAVNYRCNGCKGE